MVGERDIGRVLRVALVLLGLASVAAGGDASDAPSAPAKVQKGDGPARAVNGSRANGVGAAYMMAASFLKSGQERRAIQAFAAILEDHPNHLRARAGLIRGLAAVSICDGVEDEYALIEGSPADSGAVQSALASCAASDSRLDEALARYRYAAELDRNDAFALLAIGRLQLIMGDASGVDATLDALMARDRGPALAALLEAERADLVGDPLLPGMLLALRPYVFLPEVRNNRERLQITEVVEASDPPACDLYMDLFRLDMDNVVFSSWRADCVRRTGFIDVAVEILERPALKQKTDWAVARAMRSRVHVDVGEFEAAEEALRGLDLRDSRVLASRWYLAFRRGDSNEPHLRVLLAAHPFAPRPEALLPLTETP